MKPDKTESLVKKIELAPIHIASKIITSGVEVLPTEVPLNEFDTGYCNGIQTDSGRNCEGTFICKAFRMIISGKPLTKQEYDLFKEALPKKNEKR